MVGLNRNRRACRGWRFNPPLGAESAHWLISALSVETGIAPSVLLEQSPRFIVTMLKYIKWRNVEQVNTAKGRRG